MKFLSLNNSGWVWTGILLFLAGIYCLYRYGKNSREQSKCFWKGYVIWLLIISGGLMWMFGIGDWLCPASKLVNVSYYTDIGAGGVRVMTVSTTLFTTLMTVNLALIALAITAYIFLIGALNGRERYEKALIDIIVAKRTGWLILLSGYTGTCAVLCLIVDNGSLPVCGIAWMRYCIAAASLLDTVFLLYFTYLVINYEAILRKRAYQHAGEISRKLKETICLSDDIKILPENVYYQENQNIKEIGDLETIIDQILKNHEVEYRHPQQKKEMLSAVFSSKQTDACSGTKRMCDNYFDLLELRDSYLCARKSTEKRWTLEEAFVKKFWRHKEESSQKTALLRTEEISQVSAAIRELLEYLKRYILKEERLMDQSFSRLSFGGKNSDLSGVSFRNSALSDCDFRGANLEGTDFTGVLFHNVGLEDVESLNAVYTGAKFYGFSITAGSVFKRAVFADVDFNANEIGGKTEEGICYQFEEVSCNRANFVDCKIKNVNFKSAVFSQALLAHAKISGCDFAYADFGSAVLTGASLKTCKFHYANLENLAGIYTSWSECEAHKARMAKANFTDSKMSDCSFEGAYADNSCFSGTCLQSCDFDNAIMNKADLSYADIQSCFFRDANLMEILLIGGQKQEKKEVTKTEFTGANMTGSQIRNVCFTDCIFDEAIMNDIMLVNVRFQRCSFRDTQMKDLYVINVEWQDNQACSHLGMFADRIEFATQEDQERFAAICERKEKTTAMSPVERLICQRKSTRGFQPGYLIERELQKRILAAGLQAPSPKNRQPWHFTVVDTPEKLNGIADLMVTEIEKLKTERAKENKESIDLEMAVQTTEIIRNVSMLVFVEYICDESNEHGEKIGWKLHARGFETADLQSIGAAVQNMLLTATECGLSSLWMCDVLYAHDALKNYLVLEYPFVAAAAFGKGQAAGKRRADLKEKTKWME